MKARGSNGIYSNGLLKQHMVIRELTQTNNGWAPFRVLINILLSDMENY